jgi:arsenite transporter
MPKARLSFTDRYLTLWILLAIALGATLSELVPQFSTLINHGSISGTSIPIALGLLLMMYPPLAKVKPGLFAKAFLDRKKIGLSLLLNWIIGPILMFLLSVLFLHGKPLYMIGIILVGLARCIAMVILWNDLAQGDRAFCAALVAINSLFQMFAFSFYAFFFIKVILPWIGIPTPGITFSSMEVVKSVLIYLGIPFAFAVTLRALLTKLKGATWYEEVYIPRVSPLALFALLYTIVILFSVQGSELLAHPLDTLNIAVPLLLYFFLMFFISIMIGKAYSVDAKGITTLALTSSSNNFELAIAVSIAVFGVHSPATLAAVVGPLIEVPIMLLFVNILRNKL